MSQKSLQVVGNLPALELGSFLQAFTGPRPKDPPSRRPATQFKQTLAIYQELGLFRKNP